MNGLEHVAVVKGDLSGGDPVLVRMHALNILDDVLHDTGDERRGELEQSLRMVAEEGRGAVVLIRFVEHPFLDPDCDAKGTCGWASACR